MVSGEEWSEYDNCLLQTMADDGCPNIEQPFLSIPEQYSAVIKCLNTAEYYAYLMWRKMPYSGELEDFKQVAVLGLIRSVSLYNPLLRTSLKTYIKKYVSWGIENYISVESNKGVHVYWQVCRKETRWVAKHQSASTDTYVGGRRKIGQFIDIAYNNIVGPERAVNYTVDPVDEATLSLSREDLWGRINSTLDKRRAKVLELRFKEDMTFEEIGEKMGFNKRRAHQLVSQCLERIVDKVDLTGF